MCLPLVSCKQVLEILRWSLYLFESSTYLGEDTVKKISKKMDEDDEQ